MNGAQVTVYQPLAISWPRRKTLTASAVLAITPARVKAPALGSIDITLGTTTDVPAGVVHLSDPRMIASHFPSVDTDQATAMEGEIRAALANTPMPSAPLSAVLLSLKQAASPNVVVRNDSPKTLYSAKPASLVVFDGDPVLVPIGKRGLSYAVWTNWKVFNGGGTWFLLAGRVWMEAPRAVGPYRPAAKLPAAFGALPRNANVANARSDIPAHPPGAGTLFVSIKPAEIIVTDCPANLAVTYSSASRFAPIQGATIRYAVNTPDQVAEVPVPDPAAGPYIHDLSKVGLNEETTHGS